MSGSLLPLAGVATLVVALGGALLWRRARERARWRALAAAAGVGYHPRDGRAEGMRAGVRVVIEPFASRTIEGGAHAGVRVRSFLPRPLARPDRIRIRQKTRPGPLDPVDAIGFFPILGPDPVPGQAAIAAARAGDLEAAGRPFIATGDEVFDARYLVWSSDREAARGLLSEPVRGALLACGEGAASLLMDEESVSGLLPGAGLIPASVVVVLARQRALIDALRMALETR